MYDDREEVVRVCQWIARFVRLVARGDAAVAHVEVQRELYARVDLGCVFVALRESCAVYTVP